jgi:hypothetical protein
MGTIYSTQQIDITMTTVIRPSVLEKTLLSFSKNLFYDNKDRYRLIVNIDPVGEKDDPKTIISLCNSFFNNVIYNIPSKPSFPKAVIWVWSQVTAPWVFHLEDDWLIHRQIDINNMIRILNERPGLACLRLYKRNIPKQRKPIMFECSYQYNKDGFFVAKNSGTQFGLNPVLIRRKFIQQALPLMRNDKNPEKQFRYTNLIMKDFIYKWQYAIYGKPGDTLLVSDHGLQWRKSQMLVKPSNSFIRWVKKN